MKIPPLVFLALSQAILLSQGQMSPLARRPDWERLHGPQHISREAFTRQLDEVYAPNGQAKTSIRVSDDCAQIKTEPNESDWLRLDFAPNVQAATKPARYWRAAKELPKAPSEKPLQDLRICLDPGHIGGDWAKMEERWFAISNSKAVQEGDLTLEVAHLLEPRLKALGAKVSFSRTKLAPVTRQRPKFFLDLASADLSAMGINNPRTTYDPNESPLVRQDSLQWHSEKYFYRTSEIRARAAKINLHLRPDLVICLHFNAEGWSNPVQPSLTTHNHLHVLINGHYDSAELSLRDQRYEMLLRILQSTHEEELPLAEALAESLARHTQLPPFQYLTPNAHRVGKSPYVWARNLMANRVYECPVIYLEPYVMNNAEVHARVQAGDYEGLREVAGKLQRAICREYANGVVDGLAEYYRALRQ